MSKANGPIEKKDTFLQHVSLKNYKSIKDVEIDFKPGLNVIIGKNASGKTNFINGLNEILDLNYNKLLDTESIISAWFENDKIEIQALRKQHTKKGSLKKGYNDFSKEHDILMKVNNKHFEVNDYVDVFEDFPYFFDQVLIRYRIPYGDSAPFISLPSSFILINNSEISSGYMEVFTDDNKTRFVTDYFECLWEDIIMFYWGTNNNDIINKEWKNEITSVSERYLKCINDLVFIYSPIQAVRVNPDFNVIKQDGGQKQTITNFYLEFLIDQSWLPFNLLSDGTKRLFYIISETLSKRITNEPIAKVDLNIILLEEPELGIHPHQLHQLLEFIKEQSKEMQIILTTHSPQVLDILEPDELDRIIICHYDTKTGTQLSHLTDQQIKKAKKYMTAEAFLSDYWRFSDLEPA